jgi:hypothetical protein
VNVHPLTDGPGPRFLIQDPAGYPPEDRSDAAEFLAAMRTADPTAGTPLAYEQAVDHEAQLAVTFAGMAWTGPQDGPGLGIRVA